MHIPLVWFLLFLAGAHATPRGEYSYLIYYNNDSCGQAATVKGRVVGDNITFVGSQSETGICALESLCILDHTSEQCILAEHMTLTRNGTSLVTLNDQGHLVECDSTNAAVNQDECEVQGSCFSSSIYPNCHFQQVLDTELVANPDLLLNEQAAEQQQGLNETFYFVVYQDEACTDFILLVGLVIGETYEYPMPDTDDCYLAASCYFEPEGATCKSLPTTGITEVVKTSVRSDGVYFEDPTTNQSAFLDSSLCLPNEKPKCYFRLVPTSELFAEPSKFVTTIQKNTTTSTTSGGASKRSGALVMAAMVAGWMMTMLTV